MLSSSLIRLPLITAALLFFLIQPGSAKDYGDAFVVGSIGDARTLVPILASDSASADVCAMIFNGLVKYDKDIRLVGDLAENWVIEEGGLVITFFLKKDIYWHDGVPFSARDVEFTYQKLIDPEVRTPYSSDFERIERLEVVDDYTVRVTYKEAFAPALASWAMNILPRHLLEREDLNNTDFSRHPIGTGPYKFKSWRTQEKIELISNKDYFEKRPYIVRYIYRIIPDQATLFLELQTQGVDSSGLTPLQYQRQTETEYFRNNYRKFRLPSFGYTYLGYNLNNPKFKDKRVRQALNYAVDKEEIIKIVLLGLGKVATGPFVDESWAYNHSVKSCAYDPHKARQLLSQAGWIDTDKDGWLDKEGEVFEFTVVTNQGNEARIKTLQIIQRRLKEIGIKVNIEVIEWSVFVSEFIDKRNFEAVLLGWSLSRDPDCYDIWHSSKTKEGEFNFVGYRNPQVDDLIVKARKTFDQTQRSKYYNQIHEIIYEQQPYMFLYVPDGLSVVQRRFKGIKPAALGIGYNFIDWWVEKSEQRYKIKLER